MFQIVFNDPIQYKVKQTQATVGIRKSMQKRVPNINTVKPV